MSRVQAKVVHFEHFLLSPGGHNSEIMIQEAFFFFFGRFTFCMLGCAFFVHPVYDEYI